MFGLSLESVGGERVGREQIQRQLAAARWARCYPVQQFLPKVSEIDWEQGAGSREQFIHCAFEPFPERLRRCRFARFEPCQDVCSRHRWRSSRTMRGVWLRASRIFATSPMPADAKCGRPPPLPPVVIAIALAISPALTPLETRSSVTAT